MTNPMNVERLADRIVERLFTNAFGDRADRIAMRQSNGTDLGGWNRRASRAQIIEAIKDESIHA